MVLKKRTDVPRDTIKIQIRNSPYECAAPVSVVVDAALGKCCLKQRQIWFFRGAAAAVPQQIIPISPLDMEAGQQGMDFSR